MTAPNIVNHQEQSFCDLLHSGNTHVMGILNVTPDSFSDGGCFNRLDSAMDQVEKMVAAGVAIVDVGGESTRPGAPDVSLSEELDRVIPVVESIRSRFSIPISVDTSKADVMTAAVEAGASMINDVRALREPGALAAAAEANVPVCLMHMQGQPRTMQHEPTYDDVVQNVGDFLTSRAAEAIQAGVHASNIVFDPGFGFGKTLAHNLALLAATPTLVALGYPLLVGVSRKSMFEHLLNRKVDERLSASLAAATMAAMNGAALVRVHDVQETVDAVRLVSAVQQHKPNL